MTTPRFTRPARPGFVEGRVSAKRPTSYGGFTRPARPGFVEGSLSRSQRRWSFASPGPQGRASLKGNGKGTTRYRVELHPARKAGLR